MSGGFHVALGLFDGGHSRVAEALLLLIMHRIRGNSGYDDTVISEVVAAGVVVAGLAIIVLGTGRRLEHHRGRVIGRRPEGRGGWIAEGVQILGLIVAVAGGVGLERYIGGWALLVVFGPFWVPGVVPTAVHNHRVRTEAGS